MTEPEARYYMTQLLKGVQYLHNNRVIHRDLKLGNIFLNDDMEVKIGTFQLLDCKWFNANSLVMPEKGVINDSSINQDLHKQTCWSSKKRIGPSPALISVILPGFVVSFD